MVSILNLVVLPPMSLYGVHVAMGIRLVPVQKLPVDELQLVLASVLLRASTINLVVLQLYVITLLNSHVRQVPLYSI